jgi:hypothetical protein
MGNQTAPAAEAAKRPVRRWLQPSLFDVLLVAIPFWFFSLGDGGLGRMLADGNTGWHIRTGEWILEHKQFVYQDMFSFTKPGEPWFAWEWLSDVLFALLHQAGGIQSIALFGMVGGALYCGILFRQMLWHGANLWVALPLTFMAFGAMTIHLLARPHLFTLLLVPLAAWWIMADRQRPSAAIWLMAPLTAVWANLHGGWLALLILLGLASAGIALESLAGRKEWNLARRYALVTLACLAASLANPYGWHLHAHVWQYLRADYIMNIIGEFRAPNFRGEPMLQYEILLLMALMACGAMMWRGRFVLPLWTLFWAHASLQSARHIPIFVAVALPLVALELQRLWDEWTRRGGHRSVPATLGSLAADLSPAVRRTSVWPAVLLALVAFRLVPFPHFDDFPAELFPKAMVEQHAARLEGARLFTKDQWADYLIYRCWPRVSTFFDGRSDFFGRAIVEEYLEIFEGRRRWQELIEKHRFDTALLPVGSSLANLLTLSPGWEIAAQDEQAVLFVRRAAETP